MSTGAFWATKKIVPAVQKLVSGLEMMFFGLEKIFCVAQKIFVCRDLAVVDPGHGRWDAEDL